MSNISWPPVVTHAATIVDSYADTSVTLRQLFYRLVSDGTLANTNSAYKTLSDRTAEARRQGRFPALIDRGRDIHRHRSFDSPEDARDWLQRIYRRDRTEGQPWSIYLGVEKGGMVAQLTHWFGDLGIPILALAGYSSQTYADEVAHDVHDQDRPAVLLYAGDFDPSGEDIDRDFVDRSGCWDKVVRVALTAEQVTSYALPPQPGKAADSRSSAFVERHGELVQVELDALDPADLRQLYANAIAEFWDESAYREVMAREAAERRSLGGQA